MAKPPVRWSFVADFAETVVWLDVAKFDAAWQASENYVGAGGAGSLHGRRYLNVGCFIEAHWQLWYPHVALIDGLPEFVDGRHRFAWLRDHGASAIPVTVSSPDDVELEQLYGSPIRLTTVA